MGQVFSCRGEGSLSLTEPRHPLAAVSLRLGLLLSCPCMDLLVLGLEAAGLCRAGFMNQIILKYRSLKSLPTKKSHDSKELLHMLSEKAVVLPCSPKNSVLWLCSWLAGSVCLLLEGGCSVTQGHAGLGQGWARCPHGLWPLASPSAGQGLATALALDLISIFITAAHGKNEKVSYICVHVLSPLLAMTWHATFCCCSTQGKLHFLIGKLSYMESARGSAEM